MNPIFDPIFDPLLGRNYKCPTCERKFSNPAELKIYYFTDGEVRKQCVYRDQCPFHPDEVLDYQRDIDEFSYE